MFKKEENESYESITVKSIKAVEDIRESAVLKVKNRNPQTPQQMRKQPAAISS